MSLADAIGSQSQLYTGLLKHLSVSTCCYSSFSVYLLMDLDRHVYYCCWISLYRENWLDVVTALIERRDIDVNCLNKQGESPLHTACR